MEKRFYYQPDLPTSITCWSYTGMAFLFSMLLWLEITVFTTKYQKLSVMMKCKNAKELYKILNNPEKVRV